MYVGEFSLNGVANYEIQNKYAIIKSYIINLFYVCNKSQTQFHASVSNLPTTGSTTSEVADRGLRYQEKPGLAWEVAVSVSHLYVKRFWNIRRVQECGDTDDIHTRHLF